MAPYVNTKSFKWILFEATETRDIPVSFVKKTHWYKLGVKYERKNKLSYNEY